MTTVTVKGCEGDCVWDPGNEAVYGDCGVDRTFFFYKNEERTMISEILKKIRMLNLSCEMYVLLYFKEYLKKTELLTQS